MSEFAGRAVEGKITAGVGVKEQHPESEFTEALDAALSAEGIEAVRWEQYTPYFNDGDPCVFRVSGDVMVKMAGADEDSGDYEDGFAWGYELADNNPARASVTAFEKVIDSGHHNVLLVEKFGDHAQVTATKDKFSVEFYEHD